MPDLSLTETILGVLAALGTGSTAVAVAKRPAPGTPNDHERRLRKLERGDEECERRLESLEERMQEVETMLSNALGKFTESNERLWKAIDRLTDSTDDLRSVVARIDVEATVERELRKRAPTRGD